MTLLEPEARPAAGASDPDVEALIKEARRLRRRRWMIGSWIAALLAVAGAVGYIVASGPPSRSHRAAPPGSATAPGSSTSGRVFTPTRSPDVIQPTTLATLPNGDLLILDSSRDQILRLRPNGDLSVFAGDGRLGFTGDGGPARDAELHFTYFSSDPMAVARDGIVDVLDNGNCRIRAISPDGIIRTILRVPRVRSYPSGRLCPVTSMALSPDGSLYIGTDSEVERLSATGHPVRVAGAVPRGNDWPTHPTASNVVFSPESIAFNRAGDLYIASFSPKAVYRLSRGGRLTDLGASYATELTADSRGRIFVGTHSGEIEQATSNGIRPFYSVAPKRVTGIHWGSDGGFQENGIAVAKSGAVYVDNAQGNGFGAASVVVRVSPTRRAVLAPIHTSLAATLPKLGAPGFPSSLYPAAERSRGRALSACPSDQRLGRFSPGAIVAATRIARTYLSSQFASDIAVTDRSWWTEDFYDYASGDLGRHSVTREFPAFKSPIATQLAQACGPRLVQDSIAVTVSQSEYSNFAGTVYFLARNGHPLVYDVR